MAFVIPTIYTAVDRMSAPMRRMERSFTSLADKATVAGARIERSMRKVHNQATNIAASTAAAGAAILAPVALIAKQASDFETSVAAFRTIVSDLNDAQFASYRKEIKSVGDATRSSYIDVAASFEKIAGLNADFAKTADGIGMVSKAAITLSRASGDELGASAESLVSIMNQFGFAAEQADKAINVLAAGQAVGAASISQTAESLKVFGAIAKGSNTSIEQSVALIETLAAKSITGSEAGTALRGSFNRLQKAGLGYASGQFRINDALEEANKKVASLSTAKAKDAYITKVFGAENMTAGRILLDSVPKIKDFTTAVTNTSEAQNAAAIRSAAFGEKLKQAKERVGNLAINIGEKLLPVLDKIIDKVAPIIDSVAMWIDQNPGLTQTIIIATAALGGLLSVTAVLATVIAAVASPIGLVILGLAALALGAYAAYQQSEDFRAAVNDLWAEFKPLLSTMWELVKTIWDAVKPAFMFVAKIIGVLLILAIKLLAFQFGMLQKVFDTVAGAMENHPWLKTIGKGIMGLVTGPLKFLNWNLQLVLDLMDKISPRALQVDATAKSAAAKFAFVGGQPVGVTPIMAGEPAESVDPSARQAQQLGDLLGKMNSQQQLDVNIHTEPGTKAEVKKKSGGINVNTGGSNIAQFGN